MVCGSRTRIAGEEGEDMEKLEQVRHFTKVSDLSAAELRHVLSVLRNTNRGHMLTGVSPAWPWHSSSTSLRPVRA